MTIAEDIGTERAALAESLSTLGPSARTACGDWTALELAAHLVGEERIGGATTFIARSLVVRGVAVRGTPKMVENAIRLERDRGFAELIDRLHRPIPRLLLRPRVAPLTLFEYWTHHDDLIGGDGAAHPAPATLVHALPPLLRYQLKKLPAGIRVAVSPVDHHRHWSVGPATGPTVTLSGTCADLVRWLSGRRALADVTLTGQDSHIQALRASGRHV